MIRTVPLGEATFVRQSMARLVLLSAWLFGCRGVSEVGVSPTRLPPTPHDLSGAWIVSFHVRKRGTERDSTRVPTVDSGTGRLVLTHFQPPPPDPRHRYTGKPDWPQWGGVIQAPFDTFLQVPPFVPDRGARGLTIRAARGHDAVPVSVWLDSTGVRLWIEAICSDCGSVGGEGHFQGDSVTGEWGQEFFGRGDSGTWTMRRASRTPENTDAPMRRMDRRTLLGVGRARARRASV